MSKPAQANYLKQVRDQYENYPYPPRDLEKEKTQFLYGHHGCLDVLLHYHFFPRVDFSKNFRVLIAGGGTGDAAIMMGEQFRHMNADIVYVDISEASMKIGQERAKIRGLDNITWIHGSLLDVAKLTTGKFDYVDCSGVLHHLEKPEAGLAALSSVMKDDGALGIMVYARYGREMVYRMQRMMRILNAGEDEMQQRVENCKIALNYIPGNLKTVNEIKNYGDIGIYDMLLHSHDVAYRIPELHAFVASAGLEISHIFFNRDQRGNELYQPESYVADAKMLGMLEDLSEPDKQAVAEILHGAMAKHTFYAVRKNRTPVVPNIDNLSLVPYCQMMMGDAPETYKTLHNVFTSSSVGKPLVLNAGQWPTIFPHTAHGQLLFKYLDGKRTLQEIYDAVSAESGTSTEVLHSEFKEIYKCFQRYDCMLLKPPGISPVRSVKTIITEMRAKYALAEA